jgi:NAD(P)-dependent dehydrogenase (short-subunit alcohol dehydrogenase family)
MKVSSSVFLITGASSGIGRALAVEVARRGGRVGVIARRAELLESVVEECAAAGGDAIALPCDVTDRAAFEAAVEHVVEHYGRVDVLVNNAGRGHNAYVEETPDEQIESVFRVNVFALWYGTSSALRHMRAQGSGLIVNIASIAGRIGYPGNAAYVAAKHAVVGFSRALRTELAESGIDVMTVIPAGVTTDWATVAEGGSMLELFAYEKERGTAIANERGIGLPAPLPLLSAEEVAHTIADAIEHPVAELYTHPGLKEFIARAETEPDAFEREQTPFWVANREFVEKEKGKREK